MALGALVYRCGWGSNDLLDAAAVATAAVDFFCGAVFMVGVV